MSHTRTLLFSALVLLHASTAFAQPGPATLLSPSADVMGNTIAFSWQSASGATWYHLWLGKSDTSLVTEQWYTAEHGGCATGGTCSITLTPPIGAGPFIWHVRTWGPSGYGPWSPAHMFTVKDSTQTWGGKLPPSRRFTLVFDGEGVLDNETGLVWQRTVAAQTRTLQDAFLACAQAATGNRHGWRLATLSEMRSLYERNGGVTRLPPGHPFTVAEPNLFHWTITQQPVVNNIMIVRVMDGLIGGAVTGDGQFPSWCVRAGTSPNQ